MIQWNVHYDVHQYGVILFIASISLILQLLDFARILIAVKSTFYSSFSWSIFSSSSNTSLPCNCPPKHDNAAAAKTPSGAPPIL